MKKILMTLAAAFIMSATAFAQGGFGGGQFDPEQMIQMRTDRTVEQYKLNAEQAKQLLELNKKYNDRLMGGFGRMGGRRGGGMGQGGPGGGGFGQGGQMPELTEEQRAQMEEARKKREEAQKEYDAELEKIMTPDQFKQYQEDQKNRRQRGGGRGGFGGGQRGPRPQNG